MPSHMDTASFGLLPSPELLTPPPVMVCLRAHTIRSNLLNVEHQVFMHFNGQLALSILLPFSTLETGGHADLLD